MSTNNIRWTSFLKALLFLFFTTSAAAFLLFFGIRFLQGGGQYVAPVIVTDGYHGGYLWVIAEHPFPFLLSISLILALSGASWITFFTPRKRGHRILQVLLVPWIALIATSPVWGLIWSMYHWPPEGFNDPSVMWMFYRHDIIFGLTSGWLSALLSFPINILSYIVAIGLILLGKRLFKYKDVTP